MADRAVKMTLASESSPNNLFIFESSKKKRSAEVLKASRKFLLGNPAGDRPKDGCVSML